MSSTLFAKNMASFSAGNNVFSLIFLGDFLSQRWSEGCEKNQPPEAVAEYDFDNHPKFSTIDVVKNRNCVGR
jgi:hypothetical protein